MRSDQLEASIRNLAPWHFAMEVQPGIRTVDFNREEYGDKNLEKISTIDPYEMEGLMKVILPDGGVAGRSFLDVGCNGGGYCFVARELGAKPVHGFDVREHWINQANFIKSVRCPDDENLTFTMADAQTYTHPRSYDVTLFKGVFYHLADPIHMLINLLALTDRVMIFDSILRNDIPGNVLLPATESPAPLMSGVDSLIWLPGGPAAVIPIFRHCSFPHTRVVSLKKGPPSGKRRGRFRLIAARQEADLAAYDEWQAAERRKQRVQGVHREVGGLKADKGQTISNANT